MNLERQLKRFVRQIRPGLIGATNNPNVNLAQVIEELKASPDLCAEIAEGFTALFAARDLTTALTETGLTLESGVFSEIFKRLEYKLLPKAVDDQDILGFLSCVFDAQSDADWLEQIDRDLFCEFMSMILPDREKLIEQIAPQLFMSLEILSLRLAGMGYDPLVNQRLKARKEFQHAFMEVTRHVHALLDGSGDGALDPLREALHRCRQSLRWVRSRRNVDGASLALTYRLMKIEQILDRMAALLDLIHVVLDDWNPRPARELFFAVILAELRRFNVFGFLVRNFELLAYQITEHTGKAGEHYITRSRSEWQGMFRSAALGGVVVAGLAILKTLLARLNLPPGPEFLASGAIYAGGFVLIHSIGAALATKQPAMTASALASALDEAKNSDQAMDNLSEIIIRTIRSQLVAVLGNYLVAFPVAALVCTPFVLMNWPLMAPEKARSVIESFHPFLSLSFIYAAIAGVWLFVSGLVAGFADNWFVFNHVGARLKSSELLSRMVGPQNLDRAIQLIDHNLGFWAGNISLGFFLAAMPTLGVITGLPLDIRHITFSSAAFGAAMTTLKFDISAGLALMIAISIFVMGLVNLTVSFSLSLLVAVKSRRIRFAQTPQLLRILGQKFLNRPGEFFLPLKDPP